MLKKLGKKGFFKTLFFITSFIVLYFALVPNDHIDFKYIYADKIKHAIAFFTLSLLLNRASSSIGARIRNMLALFLFGVFIEVVQLYFPARQSSWDDVAADVVGILLFQLFYSILKMLKDRKA